MKTTPNSAGNNGVSVNADTGISVVGIAVGFAKSDAFAGAGSAVVNQVGCTTTALIENSNITTSDAGSTPAAVVVAAADVVDVTSLTGAFAFGLSYGGVGISLGLNLVEESVTAQVNHSNITIPSGDLHVTADSRTIFTNVAVSGAISNGYGAYVGSGAEDISHTSTSASLDGLAGDEIVANGNIVVAATSKLTQTGIAGAVAGSPEALALGISNVTISTSNTTTATIGDGLLVIGRGTVPSTYTDISATNANGDLLTRSVQGISVSAVSIQQLTEDTTTLSGGSAGLAGSGSVALIGQPDAPETTQASVGLSALNVEKSFGPSALLNKTTLDLGYHHAFFTGQPLVYKKGSGAALSGLTDGATYFAIVNGINLTHVA